jgi:hypothetical protein
MQAIYKDMKKATESEFSRIKRNLEDVDLRVDKSFSQAEDFSRGFQRAEKKAVEELSVSSDILDEVAGQFKNAMGELDKVLNGQEIVLRELENIRKGFNQVEKRFSIYTLGKHDELETFQDKCRSSQRFVEDTFASLCSSSYAEDLMSELNKIELEIVRFKQLKTSGEIDLCVSHYL